MTIAKSQADADCRVEFRPDEFSPVWAFKANLYVAPRVFYASEHEVKMRIVTECFDLRMMPFAGKLEFVPLLDDSSVHPLSEIRRYADLMCFFSTNEGRGCDLAVFEKGRLLTRGSVRCQFGDRGWSKIRDAASAASRVLERCQIHEANSSVNRLMKFETETRMLDSLFTDPRIKCEFHGPSGQKFLRDMGWCGVIGTVVGGYRVVAVVSAVGMPEETDGLYRIETRNVQVIRAFAEPIETEWRERTEQQLLTIAKSALEERGVEVLELELDA